MLTIPILAAVTGWAEDCAPETKPAVAIQVVTGIVVSQYTLWGAEGMAGRIFSQIGVRLEWGRRKPLRGNAQDGEPPMETIVVQLDGAAPASLTTGIMACALPLQTSGTRIHVYYDRIKGAVASEFTPILLGHVLAHEIAHVLEGVSHHSPDGLMKSYWRSHDYLEMLTRPLPIAAEDKELIRRHFANRHAQADEYLALGPSRSTCAGTR